MGDRELVRYQGLVHDSARWEGFVFRPDDIVISTPPKCGTTWTQMICALLILQTPDLDRPLSMISPWLDMQMRARDDVIADLEAQTHRRFIKTHTPLDGVPYDERVTYLCVGRDPRDVALSMNNHWDNMDMDAFVAARVEAVGGDDVDQHLGARPLRAATPRARFWDWVDDEMPPKDSGSSLLRTLRHLETFWNTRDAGNIVMLHYGDLQADLEGQMRALAARLTIDVPKERWPALVDAATFDAMRRNADKTVPNAGKGFWRDPNEFFHRGTSGQWRDLLDPDDLARYDARVAALVAPDLAAWVHAERPAI
jgi:aryl sulfotransferase